MDEDSPSHSSSHSGAVPSAEVTGYLGWRLIGYRAPAYFCFIAALADRVRLGFERGAELDDPLLEGEHLRQVHYVRWFPGQPLAEGALWALVTRGAAASAEPVPMESTPPRAQPTRNKSARKSKRSPLLPS